MKQKDLEQIKMKLWFLQEFLGINHNGVAYTKLGNRK